jgi:thiol:disulfide interchange protein DsbC
MKKVLIAIALLLPTLVSAQAITSSVEQVIRESLPSTPIDSIERSAIPGIYTITSGVNILYFHPEKRVLIFGELMTTAGENLTTPNRATAATKVLSSATKHALTIQYGEPKNVIHEFTNPDCGACLNYEKYLEDHAFKDTVRHIYFLSWNETARQKLEHIMCSEDQVAAKNAVYGGADVKEFASCEHGREQIAKQYATARDFGIDRTPTFIINGTKVIGMVKSKFEPLLQEKQHEQTHESD